MIFKSRKAKKEGGESSFDSPHSYISLLLYFISSSATIVEQRMKFSSLISSLFIGIPQRSFCNPTVCLL